MIKKISFIFIFCFGFLITVKSQTITNFGVKTGAHLIDLKKNFDQVKTSQNETGFYLGGFLEFRKSVNISFQTELIYSNSTYFTDRMSMLHIPVLLKYHISDRFELLAGPETQFLLSITKTDTSSKIFKKFILGFDVGFGIRIYENLHLEARYSLGMSNYIDYGYHQNYKLNNIQAGLAYKFDK